MAGLVAVAENILFWAKEIMYPGERVLLGRDTYNYSGPLRKMDRWLIK